VDVYKEDPKSFAPDKVLTNVPQQYNATVLAKEKVGGLETTVMKLIPKNQSASLQWMKVWVDTDEWLMKKVQVLDLSDNLTTYVIDSLKLNGGLADKEFQYTAPKDVEVIDLR
jgi:outer membrane lipoprotein-sorting protein